MQTIFSLPRTALLALALGAIGVSTTFAQTTTPTTSTTTPPTCSGGWHHHGFGHVLTAAEKAELKKDRDAALAANGTLQTEKASLKQQFEALKTAGNATPAQWQALHQQKEAFHKDLKAAILLIDPNAQAIFAKLEAAHHGHHHFEGGSSPSTT